MPPGATDGTPVDDGPARLTGVPWGRLFGYLRPHLGLFAIAVVALIIGTVAGLLLPLVIGGFVAEVVSAGDTGGLDQLVILLAGLTVVLAATTFAQTWALGVMGERIVARLRGQVFDRLVSLELDFYVRRRVGELISRLSSDVTQVRTMLTQTLTSLLSSLLSLIGAIFILFLLSPTLLLVILALAPALVIVAVVFARPLRRLSTRVQDAIAASTTTAEEALSGIRVVKSFGREGWERQRYDEDLRGVVGTATRLVTARGLFAAMMTVLGFGTLIVILWYTGRLVIEGSLTLGSLTAFLLYGIAIGTSLSSIAGIYGQFQEGAGAVARVFEIIDERPTISDPEGAARPRGRRRTHHVRWRELRIRGWSTPCCATSTWRSRRARCSRSSDPRARARRRSATSSRASGTSLRAACSSMAGTCARFALRSLRQAISLVPQEATVFGGSVAENIRTGGWTPRTTRWWPPPAPPTPTSSSRRCPTATTPSWATAARACPAASASAWPSLAPSSRTPPSSSSTRPPARWTTSPSAWSRRPSLGSWRGARRSSWHTDCRPSGTPTASPCSTTAGSWSWAATRPAGTGRPLRAPLAPAGHGEADGRDRPRGRHGCRARLTAGQRPPGRAAQAPLSATSSMRSTASSSESRRPRSTASSKPDGTQRASDARDGVHAAEHLVRRGGADAQLLEGRLGRTVDLGGHVRPAHHGRHDDAELQGQRRVRPLAHGEVHADGTHEPAQRTGRVAPTQALEAAKGGATRESHGSASASAAEARASSSAMWASGSCTPRASRMRNPDCSRRARPNVSPSSR